MSTNITINLSVRPTATSPGAGWYLCGLNGAGYYYQFTTPDASVSWDSTTNAFIFPDDAGDTITFALDDSTAEMFDISAILIYQQPGAGHGPSRQNKATMVSSPDITITGYGNKSLTLTDSNSQPGNQQRTGYFLVIVHQRFDALGGELTTPHGFISCDPFWEDD